MMSDNEQKDENREMVADILAEMRERADAMQTHGTTHGVRLAIREFADRIETALKRKEQYCLDQIRDAVNMIGHERFVAKHQPVGNTAAMREALRTCRNIAE